MQTLETLRNKIQSAEDMQSVVKTMKSMAAVNIRHYERAVESLSLYHQTVQMGLQIVLKSRPQSFGFTSKDLAGRVGVLIFGSDQGMCGDFNQKVASFAANKLDELEIARDQREVVPVGDRIMGDLEDWEGGTQKPFPIPGSLQGITASVQNLLIEIERWRGEKQVERILLFYNRPHSGSSYRTVMSQLLPVDPRWLEELERKEWPSRVLPTYSMDWSQLFSSLIREYLFVGLYRAFAESLASENASRLAAMQAAEKNIEDSLEELHAQFNQQRQTSITAELLDIVSGFEALTGEGNDEAEESLSREG
jgi:F-type H+-transporting ATPase subunit gamma